MNIFRMRGIELMKNLMMTCLGLLLLSFAVLAGDADPKNKHF
jgi:hypothetical protein